MSNRRFNLNEDKDVSENVKDGRNKIIEIEQPRLGSALSSTSDVGTSKDVSSSQELSSKSIWYEGKEAEGFYLAAGSTYIYPTNYPLREYQDNIVKKAIFKNTLVSLPTGLGKTFIAAVIMYNYYRWYPNGKIVFMAPTRPLVAQQIKACYNIMGLPLEDTTEMTGNLNIQDRVALWRDKRVFFLTPQIMVNDIKSRSCPAKMVKCLVVDEAHRAVKDYAYCHVVSLLDEEQAVFRILALSATPGNDINSVQQIIQNLKISSLEFRGEDALDIIKYTHQKSVQSVIVTLSVNIQRVREDFLQIYDKYAKRLRENKAMSCNISAATKFQILKASEKFRANPPRGMSPSLLGSISSDFTVCMSLAHSLELLQIYGLRAFYTYLNEGGEKNKAAATRLRKDDDLNKILSRLKNILSKKPGEGSYIWGHPKMYKLSSILTEHFEAAKENKEKTKAIIFCQYRVVVNEVLEILTSLNPDIKPTMFIGQSSPNNKDKGMSQAKQMDVMKGFRDGTYNCMVATSVAEEGLDIGEVDLIILMESHKSPIRLVQRIGRTGRRRNGKCIVLVTEGREEYKFKEAMAARKSYVSSILNAKTVREKLCAECPSMFPPGVKPARQLLHIEVVEHVSTENLLVAPKQQMDIRTCLIPEESSSITLEEYNQVKKELGKSILTFDKLPTNEFLFHRTNHNKMSIDELLKKDFHLFSDWNDWNLQLNESHEISHINDTELFCCLLNRFYSLNINFFKIPSCKPPKEKTGASAMKLLSEEEDDDEEHITKRGKKSKKDINSRKNGMDIRFCMAAAADKIKTIKHFDHNEIIDLDALYIADNTAYPQSNDKVIDNVIQNLENELKFKCNNNNSNFESIISSKFRNDFLTTLNTYCCTIKRKNTLFSTYKSITDAKGDIITDILCDLENLKIERTLKNVNYLNEPDNNVHWDDTSIKNSDMSKKSSEGFVEMDDLFDFDKHIKNDNKINCNTNQKVENLIKDVKPLGRALETQSIENDKPLSPLSKGTENYWDSIPNEYFDVENCSTPVIIKHIASSTPKISKVSIQIEKANQNVNFCKDMESPSVKKIDNGSFWNLDDLFGNNGDDDVEEKVNGISLAEDMTENTLIGITQMVSMIEKEKLANQTSKFDVNDSNSCDLRTSQKNFENIATGSERRLPAMKYHVSQENNENTMCLNHEKNLLDEDDDLFSNVPLLDVDPIKQYIIKNESYDVKNYSSDIFATTVFQSKCLNNGATKESIYSPRKELTNYEAKTSEGKKINESEINNHHSFISCEISSNITNKYDERNKCNANPAFSDKFNTELQIGSTQNNFLLQKNGNSANLPYENNIIDDSKETCLEIIKAKCMTEHLKAQHAISIMDSEDVLSNVIEESHQLNSEFSIKNKNLNFKRFISNKKKSSLSEISNLPSSSTKITSKIIKVGHENNLINKRVNQSAPDTFEMDEDWWFDFDFPNFPKGDKIKMFQTVISSKPDVNSQTNFKNTWLIDKVDLKSPIKSSCSEPFDKSVTCGTEKEIQERKVKASYECNKETNNKCQNMCGASLPQSKPSSGAHSNLLLPQNNKENCELRTKEIIRNHYTNIADFDSLVNNKNSIDVRVKNPFFNSHKNCSESFSSDDEIFRSTTLNKLKENRNYRNPMPKYGLKKKKRKNCVFIENEAVVSEDDLVSSSGNDDSSELDELDESFIDDQEQSNVSHAKYLQSVKSQTHGKFKIPEKVNDLNVYSQHDSNDSDYINDSFCVGSGESSEDNELSEIEIAERKLNVKRKIKEQITKPNRKRRRIKIISPDVSNINENLEISPTNNYKSPEKVEILKKRRHFIIPSDSDASDNSPLALNKKMNMAK